MASTLDSLVNKLKALRKVAKEVFFFHIGNWNHFIDKFLSKTVINILVNTESVSGYV